MKTYTFHISANSLPDDSNLEKSRIVLDGFHWPVLIFGFLWFLAKGHFMAGGIVFAFDLFSLLCYQLLGLPHDATPLLLLISNAFFAFEAGTLIRWVYQKRGMKERSIILANNETEAEMKGFSHWLSTQTVASAEEIISDAVIPPPSPEISSPWSIPVPYDKAPESISPSSTEDLP